MSALQEGLFSSLALHDIMVPLPAHSARVHETNKASQTSDLQAAPSYSVQFTLNIFILFNFIKITIMVY